MAIKGEVKPNQGGEKKAYSKYVGLFNAVPIAVNPSKSELEKILDTTLEKDPEYTGTSDEGNKKVNISIWLKEVRTGHIFNTRFYLEDKDQLSKDGKHQFINDVGLAAYPKRGEDGPQDFLTKNGRSTRKAKKGEEALYKFLRNWLSNLNYDDSSTELILNWKTLIQGKVTEIRDAIEAYPNQPVCAMATVRLGTDGKEYQGVYSYEFLPAYALECFTGNKSDYESVKRFKSRVLDSQYGCKDYYVLGGLQEYDPSKNVIATTNSPIVNKQQAAMAADMAMEDPIDDLPF